MTRFCKLIMILSGLFSAVFAQNMAGLPKAVLFDKAGREVATSTISHFGDPIIVVTYANQWCSSCVSLINALDREYQRYGAQHAVKLYAVNVDHSYTASEIFSKAAIWKNVEVLFDKNDDFMKAMQTESAPKIFFLDANQQVVHVEESAAMSVEKAYKLAADIKKGTVRAGKLFFNRSWWPVPERDTGAMYYRTVNKLSSGNWQVRDYYLATNKVQMEAEAQVVYPTYYVGTVKYFHPDGSLQSLAPYKNGKRNGLYIKYHPNGEKEEECIFTDNKITGKLKRFYSNGKLKFTGEYKNGELEGIASSYYETGEKQMVANYKQGKYDGEVTVWYKSGNLMAQGEFSNGVIQMEDFIPIWQSENGKRLFEVINSEKEKKLLYKNELGEVTVSIEMLSDGKLLELIEYKKGVKTLQVTMVDLEFVQGKYLAWYTNGQKWFELTLDNNVPFGRAMAWWENGQVKERIDFDANKFEYFDATGKALTSPPASKTIGLSKGDKISIKYFTGLFEKINTPFNINN